MKSFALALALGLSACSGDKKEEEGDTQEPGLACEDGSDCILGEEYCFIQGGTGVCTYFPDDCTADDGCDCETAKDECSSDTGGGSSCISFGTSVTIECF